MACLVHKMVSIVDAGRLRNTRVSRVSRTVWPAGKSSGWSWGFCGGADGEEAPREAMREAARGEALQGVTRSRDLRDCVR